MNVIGCMMNGKTYLMLSDDLASTQECMSCNRAKLTKNRYDGNPVTKKTFGTNACR